ncbi:MAG TPA: hypothetical protein VM146_09040 [Steroidobacteraceae bacterium]|nr:hypothetical protein [Steroidobacteraceae bacterium]
MDAPVGLLPLPRPLMTGEVLDAAFRLFRAGILRTLPYSGLVVLILELPTVYAIFVATGYLTLAYAVAFLLTVPVLGVIMLRLNAVANGQRPRFRLEIRVAMWRWFNGVIATIGAFAIPVALMVLGPAFTNGLSSEAMIFLSIPLFWPTALFVVALPAFWCGGLGPLAAIAFSLRVSVRRSWRMVGAILASLCMVSVFVLLVSIVAGLMSPLFGRADLFLSATVQSLLYLVVGAFGVPFFLAVLIVAHRDLELRHRLRHVVRS